MSCHLYHSLIFKTVCISKPAIDFDSNSIVIDAKNSIAEMYLDFHLDKTSVFFISLLIMYKNPIGGYIGYWVYIHIRGRFLSLYLVWKKILKYRPHWTLILRRNLIVIPDVFVFSERKWNHMQTVNFTPVVDHRLSILQYGTCTFECFYNFSALYRR
jgi:hypothetical protein